ncbi:hypothetical protein F6Q07_22020 [Pectobacterium parmentieri]|uniref:hypothetical protein n=1 Tax=Pectobacterium parmentieri TaxID=1905730 RepID=UPI000EB38525|nr:hypothetical protein [Pectobacterium parmentieri]AYH33243.1 hypothetical protein C5E19_17335 [Pectobacterium parmentieri]MBI0520756.1 hypothetical protein [Pectobacterium parmentieri]
MTTITIAYEVSEGAFSKIESLVDSELTNTSFFSGARISIERGDFTSIDSDDYDYVELLNKINNIIMNA